ncbi:MAG: hypothetical protein IJX38_06395 [Clostridia bacterium]|nr:hypothetical protein [Clostridia bacterium]
MENTEVFTYNYSAKKKNEIENIRSRYLPKEENKIEILRKLDNRVKMAGTVESLVIGIIGCLVFGVGMCFGLGALPGAAWLAYLLGAVGFVVMLPAYPVYRYISRNTREKIAPEILRLSDELMDGRAN